MILRKDNMPEIECMYAFVTKNKQPKGKDEGIIGFRAADGTMMPMVGADMVRVKSLIPLADEIARIKEISYRIIKFTNRTDITEEAKSGKEGKV